MQETEGRLSTSGGVAGLPGMAGLPSKPESTEVASQPLACGIWGELQVRKSSNQEAAGLASQEAQGAREAADTCGERA